MDNGHMGPLSPLFEQTDVCEKLLSEILQAVNIFSTGQFFDINTRTVVGYQIRV